MQTRVALALVVVLGATLALAGGTLAAEPAGSEAVRVHGHWVLEVRDPDGSLVARREFNNALTAAGATGLSNILARANSVGTPGPWWIRFGGSPSPCAGFPLDCVISESRHFVAASPAVAKVLTVVGDPLRLSGSLTVPGAGSISTVSTLMHTCGPTVAPSACTGTLGPAGNPFPGQFVFTSANITAVPVVAGQQVLITVTFAFTTAP